MEGKQLGQFQCPVNQYASAAVTPQKPAHRQQPSPTADEAEENGKETEKEASDERGRAAIQGLTYCEHYRLLIVSFYR